MATLDLGKIKQVWRGTYNNSTAYVVDDIVAFTDTGITSTYICVANSTGNAPSSGGTVHASWNYMAKGVADPIPSQSGNSGKALVTDGTTASWGTAGKLLKIHTATYDTQTSCSGGGTHDTGLQIVVTPQALGSKFVVMAYQQGQVFISSDPSCNWHAVIHRKVASGSFTAIHTNNYLGSTFPTNTRETDITPLVIYDSPTYSSGETITYKVTAGIYTSNYGLKYTAQNQGTNGCRSDFVIWEVTA